MQVSQFKGRANYEPNSLSQAGEDPGPRACPESGFTTFPDAVEGEKLRIRPESFADHYSQARMFFRSLAEPEQNHLVSALVFELSKVTLEHVRNRVMANVRNVDEELAKRVAGGLAMELPPASKPAVPVKNFDPSPAVRIVGRMKETLQGRSVGVLIADGSDDGVLKATCDAIKSAGGTPVVIAPKVGGAVLKDGSKRKADAQLAGFPSVLVDAVALILTDAAAALLTQESAAIQFVTDAYVHLKAIGHTKGAQALLDKAGVEPDDGVVTIPGQAFAKAAAKRYFDRESRVRMIP
jgi:catalase